MQLREVQGGAMTNSEITELAERYTAATRADKSFCSGEMFFSWRESGCVRDWDVPKPERFGIEYRRIQRLVIHRLRQLGWWVGKDRSAIYMRKDLKRSLRDTNAGGAWGRLRLELDFNCGMSTLRFYLDRLGGHLCGPRYNSRHEMTAALDNWNRYRLELTTTRLAELLASEGYEDAAKPTLTDPYEELELECRMSWHYKGHGSIWEKRDTEPYNDRDADGKRLKNGDIRYFYGRWGSGGGIRRGVVFHGLNGQWRAVSGGELVSVAAYKLYGWRPNMPRRRMGELGKSRVQNLLAHAVKEENYERAILLRNRRRELEEHEAA